MRLSETSSTVTGWVLPSSVKMRVMPTLRPTSPIAISSSSDLIPAWAGTPASIGQHFSRTACCSTVQRSLLHLDFDVDASRQIQLHKCVHGLVRRVDDVHQPQVRADLQLVARRLVDVRRAQQVEALLARRQRHRATHDRAGTLRRIDDLERRLVDEAVVERLEADTDSLALHFVAWSLSGSAAFPGYSMIFATTPAPTVLPPSRMAKRRPCSIAICVIRVTTIFTLSPGITISVPLGSSTDPVTSVVLK